MSILLYIHRVQVHRQGWTNYWKKPKKPMKYFALWAPLTWNPERLDGFSVLGDETVRQWLSVSLSFSRHLWSWVAIPRSDGDMNGLLVFGSLFEKAKAIGELEVYRSKIWKYMIWVKDDRQYETWIQGLRFPWNFESNFDTGGPSFCWNTICRQHLRGFVQVRYLRAFWDNSWKSASIVLQYLWTWCMLAPK